jgi:hypothetical protein
VLVFKYVPVDFTCMHVGRLNAVHNLSVTKSNLSIIIFWEAPFTLNITNTEPDITYCVSISSMAQSYFAPNIEPATECNITQTEFLYTTTHEFLCQNNDFYVTVTPINGAGHGHSEKTRFQCKYIGF